ncbi:hypothetical protein KKD52_03385 [Myxococcota bacterium]|nr:hypothetical protein [Myxococcota bacterium]MBU1509383.1 hypothetical protein [Myxococcota bacterium]
MKNPRHTMDRQRSLFMGLFITAKAKDGNENLSLGDPPLARPGQAASGNADGRGDMGG